MKKINSLSLESGQTLVTLLVFTVVAITVSTAAIAVIINVAYGTNNIEGNIHATQVAESGAENALLRLLRNPSYTGETLPVNDGNAIITVTGTDPKTIISQGNIDGYQKTIEVIITYTDNIMSITSWREQ